MQMRLKPQYVVDASGHVISNPNDVQQHHFPIVVVCKLPGPPYQAHAECSTRSNSLDALPAVRAMRQVLGADDAASISTRADISSVEELANAANRSPGRT